MNLFVAKLSPETTQEDLQQLFETFGVVNTAKVIMDRETGRSKCYGFVEMATQADGLRAIESLNDNDFQGSVIVVKKAEPRPDNQQRRPFGGGGGQRPFRSGGSGYGGGNRFDRGGDRGGDRFDRGERRSFDRGDRNDRRKF
ncbi:MAG: RNA-binding protein [Saprospiraceae bacterium]|nr:RNA-binding protein [Saprospiraceae bacterium]MCB9321899.1 RNA-binding protein [Lewinellaceae bacterium]